MGLSLVDDSMEEMLHIFNDLKSNYGEMAEAVAAIANKAFECDNPELGFEKMTGLNKSPICSVFLSYWNYCHRNGENLQANVEAMLQFVCDEEIIMSQKAIDGLKELLDQHKIAINYSQIKDELVFVIIVQ